MSEPARIDRACRSCGERGLRVFLDLGSTPLADALVEPEDVDRGEDRFPLEVAFCPACTLVQVLEDVPAERLFVENYHYYSSYADDLVAHARRHVEGLVAARGLDEDALVIEVASNDGYQLRMLADRGVRVLGIDPSPGPAAAAEAAGVPTLREFFGRATAERLAAERGRADVVIANNVMAHVEDLNDFVAGLAALVADGGVVTVENPSVGELLERCAFDTVYHEHRCYFSTLAVDVLVRRHGLVLVDVEYFADLHAGTLRWWLARDGAPSPAVARALEAERAHGLHRFDAYAGFGARVDGLRHQLSSRLRALRSEGATIAAYGAAAKGATLLNSLDLEPGTLSYVVDRNPHKQGKLMPGVHLPIRDPAALLADRPDVVLLLAWNFTAEIVRQQQAYQDAGGRFLVPVPEPRLLEPAIP